MTNLMLWYKRFNETATKWTGGAWTIIKFYNYHNMYQYRISEKHIVPGAQPISRALSHPVLFGWGCVNLKLSAWTDDSCLSPFVQQ